MTASMRLGYRVQGDAGRLKDKRVVIDYSTDLTAPFPSPDSSIACNIIKSMKASLGDALCSIFPVAIAFANEDTSRWTE